MEKSHSQSWLAQLYISRCYDRGVFITAAERIEKKLRKAPSSTQVKMGMRKSVMGKCRFDHINHRVLIHKNKVANTILNTKAAVYMEQCNC